MHKGLTIRTVAAVIISLFVCLLAYSYLQSLKDEVAVVVAKNNIEKGEIIKEEDLNIIKIRQQDFELFPHAVNNKEEIIGAITRENIKENTPIEKTPDALIYDRERTMALNYDGQVNKAYFIPEDMRVVAIELDAVGALNYSLKKGQFVDVIYTSTDESSGGLYSTMLLQHMEIFDIEEVNVKNDGMLTSKQIVMLLATPEESLRVAVGNRTGVLDLALNPLYGSIDYIEPVNILSFAADRPRTQEEILRLIEGYLKVQNISEVTKDELLKTLEKEKDIQTIKTVIEGSKLKDKQKEALLKLLK